VIDAVLVFDGLDYNLVNRLGLTNLLQESSGETDTCDLWEPPAALHSFLTGGSGAGGGTLKPKDTFLRGRRWLAVDLPGINYDLAQHRREERGLRDYLSGDIGLSEYGEIVYPHYRKARRRCLDALGGDCDMVVGYFRLADRAGRACFGLKHHIKVAYYELDHLAGKVSRKADNVLIVSCHGMKANGRHGELTPEGFWSFNGEAGLSAPKAADFRDVIDGWRGRKESRGAFGVLGGLHAAVRQLGVL
jgi:hypothetical protein